MKQAWDPFVLEMKIWVGMRILNLGNWGCSHRFIQPVVEPGCFHEPFYKSSAVMRQVFLIFLFLFPGFLLFKDYCMNEIDEAVPQLKFYEEVSAGDGGLGLCRERG